MKLVSAYLWKKNNNNNKKQRNIDLMIVKVAVRFFINCGCEEQKKNFNFVVFNNFLTHGPACSSSAYFSRLFIDFHSHKTTIPSLNGLVHSNQISFFDLHYLNYLNSIVERLLDISYLTSLWLQCIFPIICSVGARRARKSVIRMLVVVVVLFTVCWLPYHVMMMYDNFGGKMTGTVFQLIMFGFWLSFANSCCNPIVYAVLNRNYRKEFGRLLRYASNNKEKNNYMKLLHL